MSLAGKMDALTEIKSAPEKFHEVVSCRPHHISNICPDKVQGCALHDGDWGNAGSIIFWDYVHDGKASVSKQIFEDIDVENNVFTLTVIEGDLLDVYKSFKMTCTATAKEKGTLVKWVVEYEKPNESVPDPKTFLEFLVSCTKDIDDHLLQQA